MPDFRGEPAHELWGGTPDQELPPPETAKSEGASSESADAAPSPTASHTEMPSLTTKIEIKEEDPTPEVDSGQHESLEGPAQPFPQTQEHEEPSHGLGGDVPTTVTSEGGQEIPVRMEGEYPAYTDTQGKQLGTGHDISQGTEQKWGLDPEGMGTVEHNPQRAHVMANAEKPHIDMMLEDTKSAEANKNMAADALRDQEKQFLESESSLFTQGAEIHRKAADVAAEEAGKQYDAQHSDDEDLRTRAAVVEQDIDPSKAEGVVAERATEHTEKAGEQHDAENNSVTPEDGQKTYEEVLDAIEEEAKRILEFVGDARKKQKPESNNSDAKIQEEIEIESGRHKTGL